MLCLPLDYLPGWLFGVSAARVRPDLKEKIILYRRECYQVLWQAFKPQILTEERGDELATSTDAELAQLAQLAQMGRAITRMAAAERMKDEG